MKIRKMKDNSRGLLKGITKLENKLYITFCISYKDIFSLTRSLNLSLQKKDSMQCSINTIVYRRSIHE